MTELDVLAKGDNAPGKNTKCEYGQYPHMRHVAVPPRPGGCMSQERLELFNWGNVQSDAKLRVLHLKNSSE